MNVPELIIGLINWVPEPKELENVSFFFYACWVLLIIVGQIIIWKKEKELELFKKEMQVEKYDLLTQRLKIVKYGFYGNIVITFLLIPISGILFHAGLFTLDVEKNISIGLGFENLLAMIFVFYLSRNFLRSK